jgi:3-hydroxybutyryl-CoA dehydrogenase
VEKMGEDIKKVAVIGAGTMGHGIAQSFAQAGYQASLMDSERKSLERAHRLMESSLATLAEGRVIDEAAIPATMGRIVFTTSLEEAAAEADIVIESVVEDREVKKAVFAQLDACCPPRTLLASNATLLNIFDFVETSRPDKVLLAHWYAPPQIIPLVDVVKGPETSEASIELMVRVLKGMGRRPVVFKKPVAGYAVSRFQLALIREAFYLLDNDYLSVEELDEAVRWGLGLRMVILGLCQRVDFTGLDLAARNLKNPSFSPTPVEYMPTKIFELVKQGRLGVKSGAGFYDYGGKTEAEVSKERDLKLLRLLKFINDGFCC